MPRKLLLLLLALSFVIASNLRPMLDFTVEGRSVPCGCTVMAAHKAITAAELCAEEILSAPARLPDYRCKLRLSLGKAADSAPQLSHALLQATPGIVCGDKLYISGIALGTVSDRDTLEAALSRYIENTLPTWAKSGAVPAERCYERIYTRRELQQSIGDMIMLITGLSPVIYSDGAGRLSPI